MLEVSVNLALFKVLPMVVRIRQQELSYRQELLTLGLKMSERLPLPEASGKRRKSRPARDEEGDYECEICRANLFVSLVTNSHEEGVYCLPHAIQLLTNKRHHLKYCKLMYTYDEINQFLPMITPTIRALTPATPPEYSERTCTSLGNQVFTTP
uniref:Zinc finger C5HC2-type domain-containing protein n=1 Tax=Timema monikensis TaxID=170555 RepID=A0A7R9HTR2_9NEOP|nr:unnamed protein product [Timema monikensis]